VTFRADSCAEFHEKRTFTDREVTTTSVIHERTKVKVWVLAIALLTKRLEQQRFTISEVAADWHDTVVHYAANQYPNQPH